jgi:hypothetical protein
MILSSSRRQHFPTPMPTDVPDVNEPSATSGPIVGVHTNVESVAGAGSVRAVGAPVAVELGVDASGGAEYEALNSNCDETETKLCFVDDELDRAQVATRVISTDSDGKSGDEDSEWSDRDISEQDGGETAEDNQADGVGDPLDDEVARPWRTLEKHEIVDFARDESSVADMRSNGWIFGKSCF